MLKEEFAFMRLVYVTIVCNKRVRMKFFLEILDGKENQRSALVKCLYFLSMTPSWGTIIKQNIFINNKCRNTVSSKLICSEKCMKEI